MAARRQPKKKHSKSKRTASGKLRPKKSASKKLSAKRRAPAKKLMKKKGARKRSTARKLSGARTSEVRASSRAGSGRQAGDLQGLSRVARANSESVDELIEEGNPFEAEAVMGVENAENADEQEVRTHEVLEDDVPGEYLDKD